MLLFLKQYSICDAPKSRNKHKSEIPQHNIYTYVQNHDSPPKTMESHTIHNLFIEILVGRRDVDKNSCG